MEYSNHRAAIVLYRGGTRTEKIVLDYEASEGLEKALGRRGYPMRLCKVLADEAVTVVATGSEIRKFSRF